VEKISTAVVGVGGMGGAHCATVAKLDNVEFVAVCDAVPETAERVGKQYSCKWYTDYEKMFSQERLQAVLIATPHPVHRPVCVAAAEAGVHVFTEKPMASTVSDADEMIRVCRKRGVKLGVMYQMRTDPALKKMHELIASGAVGEILRTGMMAAGFRTQAYYNSGSWRGTWKGEGGGVLANQAPHAIDMYQWLGGMPKCIIGLTSTFLHRIQVEDVASAIFEYPNGGHGYFHVSTTEAPGTTRFEVSGDKAKLIYDGALHFYALATPIREFINTSTEGWGAPKSEEKPVQLTPAESGHAAVIKDFFSAIEQDREPMVPGEEGRNSVEIFNAVVLSSYRRKPVELPVDRREYDALLEELCRKYA